MHRYMIKGFDSATGLCEDGGGLIKNPKLVTPSQNVLF